jgi:hypothetical protein
VLFEIAAIVWLLSGVIRTILACEVVRRQRSSRHRCGVARSIFVSTFVPELVRVNDREGGRPR